MASLIRYLLIWKSVGYGVAFVGMIVEGELLLLVFAFLTSQGYFNFFYMFASVFFGAIFGDVLWYWLGVYLFRNSKIQFPAWVHRLSHPLDRHLRDRPGKTIFISKFVYGTNKATLTRAGALDVNMKKFLVSNVYANLVWILSIGGLGYVFGASIPLMRKYIRDVEIILLLTAVLFLVASHFIALYYEKEKDGEDV